MTDRRPDPPSSWEEPDDLGRPASPTENDFIFEEDETDDPPYDVEHSLPSLQQLYSDRAINGKYFKSNLDLSSSRLLVILAVSFVAVVAIIGLSAGISKNTSGSIFGDASRDTALLNLLFRVYKDAGLDTNVLTQQNSPQFAAIQWLADTDSRQVEIGPEIVQRYVLAVMYNALGGSEWTFTETGWMNNEHECEWNFGLAADQAPPSSNTENWRMGVLCDGEQQVNFIFLPSNNLKGRLPQEVGLLTNLVHFSVYKNELSGTLPQSMSAWTNLDFLNLESNKFTGQLQNWFSFPKLQYLTLGNNQFSGDLPASFSDMKALHEAALDKNIFTGGVDVFNGCTNLKILFLEQNQLDGTIGDDTFSDLSLLQELDMSNNKLHGNFPEHFYEIDKVDLHFNLLSGSLPEVMYDTRPISYLSLYENNLKGSIPSTIGDLSSLTHLDFSKNQLTGAIPDDLQGLINLEYLFLQKNLFSAGTIPAMSTLINLKELSLQETNRISQIPTWIGSLKELVLLDLHDNGLSGNVPSNLGLLSNMRFLFLNKNALTGELPWELMYMEQLSMLMIDQNEISGSDAAVCGDNKPSKLASFIATCDSMQCDCCTKCCSSNDDSCNTLALQVNSDDKFMRNHYVFSEDLVFSRSDNYFGE